MNKNWRQSLTARLNEFDEDRHIPLIMVLANGEMPSSLTVEGTIHTTSVSSEDAPMKEFADRSARFLINQGGELASVRQEIGSNRIVIMVTLPVQNLMETLQHPEIVGAGVYEEALGAVTKMEKKASKGLEKDFARIGLGPT